jgi:hypothetical protein
MLLTVGVAMYQKVDGFYDTDLTVGDVSTQNITKLHRGIISQV